CSPLVSVVYVFIPPSVFSFPCASPHRPRHSCPTRRSSDLNAAALTAHLMKRYGIPLERVIQHNAASGKDCPRIMRAGSKGVTWGDFRTMVSGSKAKDI